MAVPLRSVAAATLVLWVSAGAVARAQCPGKLGCDEVRSKLTGYRRALNALEKRLANQQKESPADDAATLERNLADLRNLARCSQCSKQLRSEADTIQAGFEGMLAEHYDSWGMKRGEDGRRSFRATRDAALVDPKNLGAWTTYGKALVTIAGKTARGRIAAYLKIDLPLEMRTTASKLRELLPGAPGDLRAAHDTLAALERLIK